MPTSMATAPVVDVCLALVLGAGVAVHEWSGRTGAPSQRRDPLHVRISTAMIPSICAAIGVATGVLDLRAWVPAAGAVYATQRLARGWPGPVTRHLLTYLVALRVAGVVGLWALLALIPGVAGSMPVWFLAPLVGGIGGLACAAVALSHHSAWWRPTLVAWTSAAWAVPLAALASNWATLCLGAAGLALATLHTGKTLIASYRPAQVLHPHVSPSPKQTTRRLLHAATWAALATSMVFAAEPPGTAEMASDVIFGTVLLLAAAVILSSITGSAGIDGTEWPLSPTARTRQPRLADGAREPTTQ